MPLNLAKMFQNLSKKINKAKVFIKKYKIEFILFLIALFFSAWLMFSSFSYLNGSMLISAKAWSDFASHIPLIRSFSFGDNFLPPQYPLFSGPIIKYHFLFYAVIGLLEKSGLRIDYALNILSALGFSFLILMIYIFAKEIFKSRAVALMSVLFFLFNGSLTFIKFFSSFPLSASSLSQIINNNKFIAFGPYDGSLISAFWNLNIYTNQRHLGLSFALSLLLIYLFLKLDLKKKHLKTLIFLGIILGASFVLNMAVFLMSVTVLFLIALFFKNKRKAILISLGFTFLIAFPQYLFSQLTQSFFKPAIHFGYLATDFSILGFLNYWFQNLGLHLILLPVAFVLADNFKRKIFLSFFSLFLIGNFIQFSPEIAANHKFFNYFMIIGAMFSAYVLYLLWKKIILRPLVAVLFFLLIISGIIDFFPIYNDNKIALADYTVSKDIAWIMQNTKPDSVFLNSQYLYDNASMAGRKIFLGWPYFAWSQGYNTNQRDNLRKKLLGTNDLNFFCDTSLKNGLDYLSVNPSQEFFVNTGFFKKNLIRIYQNSNTSYLIYDINKSCR